MADIKETLELLGALKDSVEPGVRLKETVSKVLSDGKVTITDVVYVRELLSEVNELVSVLRPGFEGVAKIQDELKDLTLDEGQQVLEAFAALVLKVATLVKK